ncbi:MAG: hypothetical protein WAU75_20845 [Solirubrobacteraceae bacterium]
MAAGTDTAPPELDDVVPVLALVPVPVLAADVDDEVGAAAADDVDDVDDVVLLLPQPTMAPAHTSGTATDSHVLIERIALLLIESQKVRREDRQDRVGRQQS